MNKEPNESGSTEDGKIEPILEGDESVDSGSDVLAAGENEYLLFESTNESNIIQNLALNTLEQVIDAFLDESSPEVAAELRLSTPVISGESIDKQQPMPAGVMCRRHMIWAILMHGFNRQVLIGRLPEDVVDNIETYVREAAAKLDNLFEQTHYAMGKLREGDDYWDQGNPAKFLRNAQILWNKLLSGSDDKEENVSGLKENITVGNHSVPTVKLIAAIMMWKNKVEKFKDVEAIKQAFHEVVKEIDDAKIFTAWSKEKARLEV